MIRDEPRIEAGFDENGFGLRALEAARAALGVAFDAAGPSEVVSFTSTLNERSRAGESAAAGRG